MKYILLVGLGYLAYRLVRPLLARLTGFRSERDDREERDSLDIPEEDIRDADYKDID